MQYMNCITSGSHSLYKEREAIAYKLQITSCVRMYSSNSLLFTSFLAPTYNTKEQLGFFGIRSLWFAFRLL